MRGNLAVRSVAMSTPKSIKDNIITQAANMLACYRKNCAQSTTAGQLILPETLKLLPVYVTSLIKCDALTGSKWNDEEKRIDLMEILLAQTVTTDDRTWLMQRIMSMDIKATFAYLYPRVFALVCRNFVAMIQTIMFLFSTLWMRRIFHHL